MLRSDCRGRVLAVYIFETADGTDPPPVVQLQVNSETAAVGATRYEYPVRQVIFGLDGIVAVAHGQPAILPAPGGKPRYLAGKLKHLRALERLQHKTFRAFLHQGEELVLG